MRDISVGRTDPASGVVFLSYASEDAEAARRICQVLRAGAQTWLDLSELRGGGFLGRVEAPTQAGSRSPATCQGRSVTWG
jgi:hypothetical protein